MRKIILRGLILAMLILAGCTQSREQEVVQNIFNKLDQLQYAKVNVQMLQDNRVLGDYNILYSKPANFVAEMKTETSTETFFYYNGNAIKYYPNENVFAVIEMQNAPINLVALRNYIWPLVQQFLNTYTIQDFHTDTMNGIAVYKFRLVPNLPIAKEILTITARQSDYLPIEVGIENQEVCNTYDELNQEFGLNLNCKFIVLINDWDENPQLTNADFDFYAKYPTAQNISTRPAELGCPQVTIMGAIPVTEAPYGLPEQVNNFIFTPGQLKTIEESDMWGEGITCKFEAIDYSVFKRNQDVVLEEFGIQYNIHIPHDGYYLVYLQRDHNENYINIEASESQYLKIEHFLYKRSSNDYPPIAAKEVLNVEGTEIATYKIYSNYSLDPNTQTYDITNQGSYSLLATWIKNNVGYHASSNHYADENIGITYDNFKELIQTLVSTQ